MMRSVVIFIVFIFGCTQDTQRRKEESFQGVIELEEQVLGFEVGGRVSSIGVARGDFIKEKTLIGSLDDSLARFGQEMRAADVKVAEARLSLLRSGARQEDIDAVSAQIKAAQKTETLIKGNLDRQKKLVAGGAAAKASLDTILAELNRASAERKILTERLAVLRSGARPEEIQAAQAQVDAAQAALALEVERLTRYSLLSPVSGSVIGVHIKPGGIVAPGTPAITIADTLHPYADIFVPQNRMAGLVLGATASIRVDAETELFSGSIEAISPRVEFTPRFLFSEKERPNLVLRVRVRIDDPTERLHSGVPAFVVLKPSARSATQGAR